ncbi:MAG TPA: hypothetical protein VHX65_09150 [Pirellulales bacterium]|jgi:hypothetical protein|nr:hypothetical protein [Pirellulales bacterium]
MSIDALPRETAVSPPPLLARRASKGPFTPRKQMDHRMAIAFFSAWTTYGTWLPGDARGWWERD